MIDIDRFNWFLTKLSHQLKFDFGRHGVGLVGAVTYKVTIHTSEPLMMLKFVSYETKR